MWRKRRCCNKKNLFANKAFAAGSGPIKRGERQMKQKWKKALEILRGRQGSSIVLVIVAMLFVSILGATLLYMSYTGFMVKVTQRRGEESFYDASDAMKEVEAGIQQVVTESIASAYNKVLVRYSDPDFATNMTDRFQEQFRQEVWGWKSAEQALFTWTGSSYQYQTAVMKAFLTHPEGVTLAAAEGKNPTAVYDAAHKQIVIQNVKVTCDNAKSGFVGTVTTDLTIDMPDFYYVLSEYNISGLPEFAVVAKKELKQVRGNSLLSIQGSAYAGSMNIDATGSSLTVTGGSLICGGNMTVKGEGFSGRSRMTVTDSAAIWANRVNVLTGGSVAFGGSTYLADDLALEGSGSAAVLGGQYYGFGADLVHPEKSSAILVNGRNTKLDLTGIDKMMLAGQSFVNGQNGVLNSDVMMGQSMAVKSDQRAYLIPTEYLIGETRNPVVQSVSQPSPSPAIDSAKQLWSIGGEKKTLASYGVAMKPVIVGLGSGQKATYFFMQFDTLQNANAYFKDYFTVNKDKITEYLSLYTTLNSTVGTMQTSGYSLTKNDQGSYELRSAVARDSITTPASQLETMYQQLKKTLSSTPEATTADNPYDYIVNEEKIKTVLPVEGQKLEFTDGSGDVVALIVRGNYTIDSETPAKVQLILATGDVDVERDFSGLIVSGGVIDMNQSVHASEREVVSAFASAATHGGTDYRFSEFLNVGVEDTTDAVGGKDTYNWKLGELVRYKNWTQK